MFLFRANPAPGNWAGKAMRVLGIDPGLRNLGWGVIDVAGARLTHVANGICHSAPGEGEGDLAQRLVSLHSGLTPAQRLRHWLAAHTGQARIVLGTRMAVFASMPKLALIVVDEEHDPSYKQQEGARYSARDLAVYRAQLTGAKVILGSATPSLESWHHSRAASDDRIEVLIGSMSKMSSLPPACRSSARAWTRSRPPKTGRNSVSG